MSGLCGWFSTGIAALPIEQMAAPLVRFDGATLLHAMNDAGAVAIAAPHRSMTLLREPKLLIALWGQPVDGLGQLWRTHGERMVEFLAGPFALAVLDAAGGQAFLATDRSGTYPICYQLMGQTLIFATSADALIRHPAVSRQLDHQAIYNYLYFHMVPSPASVYHEQQRLLPGECLSWKHGRLDRKRYWRLAFQENDHPPFAQRKDEFLGVVQAAVRKSVDGRKVGAFLSGGTDSSTITAMLGEVLGEPARTYSIGFDVPEYDELGYARIVACHFGTSHQERYVTADDVVDAVPLIAAAFDMPFGNASAVPAFFCAQMAKADGIERLLGGDGGDELFGGNERYARQALFSRYEAVPSALRQMVIEPLLFGLAGPVRTRLLCKARSYIEQALVPLPARLETYNLLQRLGIDAVLEPQFLASIDRGVPHAILSDAYWQAQDCSQINHLLALDMKLTLADNDLPKVMRACELAGVEAAFPLLDDAVVALAARLTPEQKLKGTRLRTFFKQAMRGILPPEVLSKKKHGFGMPFGQWIRSDNALRELAFDSLGALKSRRVVRASFIDSLLNAHLAEHAAYHGTMVWVLMMLEQWFIQRRPGWSNPLPVTRQTHEPKTCQA